MQQIHITDGQLGNILDYITANNIISDIHKKSLENTLETYQFIAFADKRYSEFLEKRNRIIIPDEDGTLREFIIAEAIKYKDSEGYKQQVFANASYLELKKASVIYPNAFRGSASQHSGRALNDTGWRLGTVESPSSRTIQISINNHANPYEYLKRIAREFGLELRFRIEHDGNKVTGRYVDLLERLGMWQGREVEFGKDLDGIRRIEKQDIVTALLGLGPEDEDGQRIEVMVTDNEALQRWGRIDEYGNLNHLIEPYEIQSERTDMTEAEAIRYTRTALNKRIDTQVSYEMTIVDLEAVPGMENKKIRFGDTIRIKDTKFNPPLYIEARIFEQSRSIKSQAEKEIKLGDFVEYTEEQVNAIWKQLEKQIRNRVSRSEMAEYTYNKVTIDLKDEETYEEGKQFAEAVGSDAKGYADIVAEEAEESAKEYAEDRSEEAYQQAIAYAVAEELYNQKMQEIALELEGKVEYEYIDGQLELKVDSSVTDAIQVTVDDLVNTRADLIQDVIDLESDIENKLDVSIYNQKILEIESDIADKVDGEWVDGRLSSKADADSVYTISQIDNRLNNYVGLSTYETDKDGYVERFESAESRITQNETEIATTVKQTEFEALENEVGGYGGRLTEAESNISQNASAIESKVSQTDFNSLTGRVTSAESSITQQAGLIEQRVTKTEYTQDIDGIVSDISSHETRITQTESEIASTVKRTEFEALEDDFGNFGTRLGTAETSIGQNATAISQRATKTEFNSLTGRVSTAEGSITTMAGQISLKASQSDLDTVTGDLSTLSGEISTMAGEISLKAERSVVEGLRTDFDNLEIGGRNLIPNSDFSNEFKYWTMTFNSTPSNLSRLENGILIVDVDGSNISAFGQSFSSSTEQGVDYIVSIRARGSGQLRVRWGGTGPYRPSFVDLTDSFEWYVFDVGNRVENSSLIFEVQNGTVEIDKTQLEKGNKATDWTPAPEDIEAQFDTVTSDISELVVNVDGISGTVSSLSQTVGTQGTNISNLTSQLNIQAGLIEGKVDSTTYNTGINGVINDIKSHNTRITQNANAINLRATKTEVDNLAGEVSSNTAQLSVQAGQISSKVSQTEFDNMEIGGRNYLQNSDFSKGIDVYWARLNSSPSKNFEMKDGLLTVISDPNSNSDFGRTNFIQENNLGGQEFITVSSSIKGTGSLTVRFGSSSMPTKSIDNDDFKRVIFVIPRANFGNGNLIIDISSGELIFNRIKAETGNKATDWSPAPEDVQGQIDGIQGTISNHSTSISQNATAINLRATKTEVNALTGRVSSAESSISQNATAITQRATNTTVNALTGRVSTAESSITTMAGQISSKVSSTDFTGNKVVSMIEQTAANITLSANKINFDGHVFGSNATFTGTIRSNIMDTRRLIVGRESLSTWDMPWSEIEIKHPIRVTTNVYELGDPIKIGAGNGVAMIENGSTSLRFSSDGIGVRTSSGEGTFGARNSSLFHMDTNRTNGFYMYKPLNVDGGSRVRGDLRIDGETTSSGAIKINASGSNQGLQVSDGSTVHTINAGSGATYGGQFIIYSDRGRGSPFRVRSHINGGSYRNDFWVEDDGIFYSGALYNNTSSNSANARVSYSGSTGQGSVYRVTSARKYKHDIQKAIDVDYRKVLELDIKSWLDKGDIERNNGDITRVNRSYGLIADEVAELGLSQYVDYEGDEIEGLAYERLWTLLIPITKEHDELLKSHNEDIASIRRDFYWMEMENDLLKRRIEKLENGVV